MTVITAVGSLPEARSGFLLHRLVADHAQALLAYAERLLRDRYTAEDIVQETLIRAWEHTDRLYGNQGSVRGWLLTVTRNLVIDEIRGARLRHETVGAEHHDAAQADHSDAILTSIQVRGLLRQLSQEHREVLVHTYLWGRTVQETAEILGVPPGTVKSRQHYALKSLHTRAITAGR
ncbi:sigma-70 family RNA polymerase sigma factor [Streptomyces sp. NBC_01589]|uniref:sigma-70 family RNA polymerase sigma factor n=1 Tax=unclassified Streptomyces TaxID=2593676 RepID=UPI00386D33E0